MWSGLVLVLLIFYKGFDILAYKTVYTINFGESVVRTDSNGIVFQKSTGHIFRSAANHLENYLETRSYTNVHAMDLALYQSIRLVYNLRFNIPLLGDGKYLLILKFLPNGNADNAELMLNENHQIFKNFNVRKAVGNRDDLAYDELIVFSVCGNRLKYKNEESSIIGGYIKFDLKGGSIKACRISALALIKGDVETYRVQPKLAINFNSSDFLHQADFECRGNDFFKIETTTTTTIATISTTAKLSAVNNSFYFFNFFMSKIQTASSPTKSNILSADEI